MGRGRQKAKQRKVARNLKYTSPDTDYRALERELVSRESAIAEEEPDDVDEEYSDYEYGYYADEDEEDAV